MKKYTRSQSKGRWLRALSVMTGIMLNVLLSYISYRFELPVRLDCIGTVSVAALGGLFPGILTAIVTNSICTVFNNDSLYFGVINVMLAMYTSWFIKEKSVRKLRSIDVHTGGEVEELYNAIYG